MIGCDIVLPVKNNWGNYQIFTQYRFLEQKKRKQKE